MKERSNPSETLDPIARLKQQIEAMEEVRDRLVVEQAFARRPELQEIDPLLEALHEGVAELTEEIVRRQQAEVLTITAEQAQELITKNRQLQDEITGHHRADAELQALKELHARLIELLPGGYVKLSGDGSVVSANERAQRFLELSYDEGAGSYRGDWRERLFREGTACPTEAAPGSRCLVSGAGEPPAVFAVRRHDGTLQSAEFRGAPLTGPDGRKVTGAVLYFSELPDRASGREEPGR